MGKMKKGALFTIGTMLVVIALFTFATLIYTNSLESKKRVAEIGVLDRIYDIDVSIQNSLKEIFDLSSGISIEINNQKISFTEDLPSENDSEFEDNNENFKDYVEDDNKNNPKIIINTTKFVNNLPLHIKPHNIIYTHPEDFGDEEIDIIPEEINMNGYDFTINVFSQTINELLWNEIHECTFGDKGCIKFDILVKSDSSSKSDSRNIDASKHNELEIKIGSSNILITIDNPAQINIQNNVNKVNIKSEIDLKAINNDKIVVFYPDNVIITSLDDLKIKKQGTARIL